MIFELMAKSIERNDSRAVTRALRAAHSHFFPVPAAPAAIFSVASFTVVA